MTHVHFDTHDRTLLTPYTYTRYSSYNPANSTMHTSNKPKCLGNGRNVSLFEEITLFLLEVMWTIQQHIDLVLRHTLLDQMTCPTRGMTIFRNHFWQPSGELLISVLSSKDFLYKENSVVFQNMVLFTVCTRKIISLLVLWSYCIALYKENAIVCSDQRNHLQLTRLSPIEFKKWNP